MSGVKKHMDFSNRNVQPQQAAPGAQNTAAGPNNHKKNRRGNVDKSKVWRVLTVALVAAVAILIAAVAVLISSGSPKSESEYVDSSKLQAVFLNTGQVYFGHIETLNNKYFVVTDIYYLQTTNTGTTGSNANANSNVTLVKLGCELHEPYDQMVINSDQVTFWENLQDNGQVAKAVSTFQKQNPNGQKCADQSSSAPANSGSNAQNAGSSNSNN